MKKKILIIGLTERMGGVETFIYNTTKFSEKEKYEYYYLVHGAENAVYEKEINDFYGNDNHIFFVDSIKKHPFKTMNQLRKFYKDNKFDFIHLQTGSCAEVMYVFPFIYFMKAKLISHSHCSGGNNKFKNNFYKLFLRISTSKYLSCSKVASDWLFGNISEEKLTIINNGVDHKRFEYNEIYREEIRRKYNISDSTKLIGHVGRLSKEKNHEFMLEILAKLNHIENDYKLMFVGVGPLEDSLKELAIRLKISNKVIFAGKQMEIEKYYSAFDIFLMPSLYEGLPIAGIESQCEGLDCVFSDTIDHQIMITDRANMLSLNESADYWAQKIQSLNLNHNRKKYSDVIDKNGYSIHNTIQILEKVYECEDNE